MQHTCDSSEKRLAHYLSYVKEAVKQSEIGYLRAKGIYDVVIDSGPLDFGEVVEMEEAFGYVRKLPHEHPFWKDVTQEKVEEAYAYFKDGRLRKRLVSASSLV